MARTPAAGHNSGALSDEDASAIQLAFTAKIRAQQAKAAIKKAEAKAEQNLVNGLFSQVRGILQYTREQFEEVLEKAAMDEDEFIASEAARAKRFSLQGLPVGAQLDMFPKHDAADDQARAHANGLRAGRRGDEREMPDTISPVFLGDWLRGYDEGQAELGAAFIRVNEIEAAKNAKAPVLREEPPEDDDDGGEELTEAAIQAGVKKTRKSKIMEPTPAETEFAAA